MDWLRQTLGRLQIGVTWQRLLGSMAFAFIPIVVVFGRSIVAGQVDLPLMLAGWLFVTAQTYLVWPGLDLERRRRWKIPHR